MAERRPIVLVNGETRELPSGDTLPYNALPASLIPFIPIARVKFDATSGAIAGVVQYGLNTGIGTSGVQYISAGTYDLNFSGTYTTTTFAVIGDGLANRKVSLSSVTSSSKIRITRNRTTDGITENGYVFCIVFADPA